MGFTKAFQDRYIPVKISKEIHKFFGKIYLLQHNEATNIAAVFKQGLRNQKG